MTKSQIEKFAVGYSSYPTDCVEEVLKITNFDEDVAREILDNKEKTLAIWQNGTIMIDGVTLCGGSDWNVPSRPREVIATQMSLFPEKQKYPIGEKKQRWVKKLN